MSGASRLPLLTRRSALLGAVALGAVPLMGPRALAQTASEPTQAPGFYRRRLGEMLITQVNDGVAIRPLADGFVTNAPFDSVKGALADAFLPTDSLAVPFSATLVETGSRKVLIDVGNGASGPPSTGRLIANLAAAGVTPEQIDTVVISHFHPDHMNGLIGADGKPAFPNAAVMAPEVEFAFWLDDRRMNAAPDAVKGLFEMARGIFGPIAKQVQRYRDGQEIVPGITALAAPGHTPGHMAFTLASGDAQMLILSDTALNPALFARNPDWSVVFDLDKEMARETRRRLLDRAASDRLLIAGYHFPFPGTGHVVRDGTGFDYVPTEWRSAP
jgi:glyoxylase-like metal-dependent hydrolase (beta-lactamase superfamily II)